MDSEQSNIIMLDVFYGPEDVTVTPYAETVSLVLGDYFDPITCSAKCNPKYNIRWKKDGIKKITTHGTLLAKRISEADGGIYQCTATHPKNESRNFSTSIMVTVLGKPTRPVLSLQPENPFVGDKIRLTCESRVQRWPIGVFSSLNYKFSGFQGGRKEDGTLVIKHVSKQNTGTNISCTAVDDRGMDSEQSNIITLDVFSK